MVAIFLLQLATGSVTGPYQVNSPTRVVVISYLSLERNDGAETTLQQCDFRFDLFF